MNDCVMEEYLKVFETEDSDPIEIPIENDDTVLFSTLSGQFPRVSGLKYKPQNASGYRAVKLSDGKLYKPAEGWSENKLICVFAKEGDNKRKFVEDNELYGSVKTKRLETFTKKCTDLIVLNLGWKVDEDVLKKYFSQWGEVVLAQIKRERDSNHSRGYGFVRFGDYESQVACLMVEKHVIDGRICAVKVPFSKTEADKQEISKKIHVSYESEDVTADDLRTAFSEYGTVCDIFVPKPFRKFAFVTFDTSEPVQQLIGQTFMVSGHSVVIGSAVPKINTATRQQHMAQVSNVRSNQYGYTGNYNHTQQPIMTAMPGHFTTAQHYQRVNCDFGGQIHNGGRWEQNYRRGASNNRYQQQNQNQYYVRGAPTQPSPPHLGPDHTGMLPAQAPDMGHNTAAMAALNILNNPNVVAAIISAAATNPQGAMMGMTANPMPPHQASNVQKFKYNGTNNQE